MKYPLLFLICIFFMTPILLSQNTRENEVANLMSKAWDFEKNNEYGKAEEQYKFIISNYPETKIIWQVWSSYAKLYEKQNNIDKSIEIQKQAIAATNLPFLMEWLGNFYLYKNNDTKNAKYWYIKAKCLYLEKNNISDIHNIDNKINTLPADNADSHPYVLYKKATDYPATGGDAYLWKAESIESAIAYLDTLVCFYPNWDLTPEALFKLGALYEFKATTTSNSDSFYTKAIASYRTIINKYPSARFSANFHLPEFTYQPANPKDVSIAPYAQYKIALLQLNNGPFDGAYNEFEKLISMAGNKEYENKDPLGNDYIGISHYVMGNYYYEQGKYDNAIKEYLKIPDSWVEFHAVNNRLYGNISAEKLISIARCYDNLGEYQKAISNYKIILYKYSDINYSNSYGNYSLYSNDAINEIKAIFLQKLSDTTALIKTLKGTLEIITDEKLYNHIQFTVANLYEQTDKYSLAIKEYKKLLLTSKEPLIEQEVHEGDFGDFYLTESGLAKVNIELLNSKVNNTIPKLSIIFPYQTYYWDKAYCFVDSTDLTDIESLKSKIYLTRNEIFARHGYIFNKQELKDYFEQQFWYQPNQLFKEDDLNSIEKQNINYLKKYENKLSNKR